MTGFSYRNGVLHAEDVPLDLIAEECGTPVYVYSQTAIETAYRDLAGALDGLGVKICYAVKANANLAVIRTLARQGAGADVVSGGELDRAVAAGIAPADVVFSGVGKTRGEIAGALRLGIGQFNVESEAELRVVAEVAAGLGVEAPVALRINPDIDVDTVDEIATGTYEHKFGIPIDHAEAIYRAGAAMKSVRMVGLAVHIGSQILDLSPFEQAYSAVAAFTETLRGHGLDVDQTGPGLHDA